MTATTRNWRDHAACLNEDPEVFYPRGESAPYLHQVEDAKAVCRRCPVRGLCLQWAMETNEPEGVWGGTTPDERKTHRRRVNRRKNGAAS